MVVKADKAGKAALTPATGEMEGGDLQASNEDGRVRARARPREPSASVSTRMALVALPPEMLASVLNATGYEPGTADEDCVFNVCCANQAAARRVNAARSLLRGDGDARIRKLHAAATLAASMDSFQGRMTEDSGSAFDGGGCEESETLELRGAGHLPLTRSLDGHHATSLLLTTGFAHIRLTLGGMDVLTLQGTLMPLLPDEIDLMHFLGHLPGAEYQTYYLEYRTEKPVCLTIKKRAFEGDRLSWFVMGLQLTHARFEPLRGPIRLNYNFVAHGLLFAFKDATGCLRTDVLKRVTLSLDSCALPSVTGACLVCNRRKETPFAFRNSYYLPLEARLNFSRIQAAFIQFDTEAVPGLSVGVWCFHRNQLRYCGGFIGLALAS